MLGEMWIRNYVTLPILSKFLVPFLLTVFQKQKPVTYIPYNQSNQEENNFNVFGIQCTVTPYIPNICTPRVGCTPKRDYASSPLLQWRCNATYSRRRLLSHSRQPCRKPKKNGIITGLYGVKYAHSRLWESRLMMTVARLRGESIISFPYLISRYILFAPSPLSSF